MMIKKTAIMIVLLCVGLAFLFSNIDKSKNLHDIDEAAWIFNGYYLDLYLSGDWKNPDWKAFEKYAQHPPGTAYVFGALFHAIGEPIKSMEPRRYWFENDLKIVYMPATFMKGLAERFSERQLIAGRYMSCVFAWLAAIAAGLFAWRLAGRFGGIITYLFIIFQPAYGWVATLCAGDTFIMFVSIVSVWMAWEMGWSLRTPLTPTMVPNAVCHREESEGRRGDLVKSNSHRGLLRRVTPRNDICVIIFIFATALAFSSKISSYALIPAILIASLLTANGWEAKRKTASLILLGIVLAFGITILLDPGMQSSPIGTLLERFAARTERVEIQKIVFADGNLVRFIDRVTFAAYGLFFASAVQFITFLFFIIGLVSFAFGKRNRGAAVAIALGVYFLVLTVAFLPMAWTRYVVLYLPFVLLPAAVGAEKFKELLSNARIFTREVRIKYLFTFVLIVSVATLLKFGVFYEFSNMKRASSLDINAGRIFAMSLMGEKVGTADRSVLSRYLELKGFSRAASLIR